MAGTLLSEDLKSLTRGSINSAGFKRNRQKIEEFPCYGTQEDLDVFVALSVVCNLRKSYVPCIDCNKCYQKDMHKQCLCRYPEATFSEVKTKSGQVVVDGVETLGERILYLKTDSVEKSPEKKLTLSEEASEALSLLRQEILDLPLFAGLSGLEATPS